MFSKQDAQINIQTNYEKGKLTPDLYFQIQLENEISRNDLEDVKTLVRVLRKNSTFLVNKTLRKLLNLDSSLKKREVIRNHIFKLTEQAFTFLEKFHFWLVKFNILSLKKLTELKKIEDKRKKISQSLEIPSFQLSTNESNKKVPLKINIYEKTCRKPVNIFKKNINKIIKQNKKPLNALFVLDVKSKSLKPFNRQTSQVN
jgi:hypothetical protein